MNLLELRRIFASMGLMIGFLLLADVSILGGGSFVSGLVSPIVGRTTVRNEFTIAHRSKTKLAAWSSGSNDDDDDEDYDFNAAFRARKSTLQEEPPRPPPLRSFALQEKPPDPDAAEWIENPKTKNLPLQISFVLLVMGITSFFFGVALDPMVEKGVTTYDESSNQMVTVEKTKTKRTKDAPKATVVDFNDLLRESQ